MIARTRKDWEEYLNPSEYQALRDSTIYIPEELQLSANEVLDVIIDFYGGIASGHEIRSMISRVYGVELE